MSMAILTNTSKVDNAIRLYKDAQSMYFGLGRSVTPWNDDSNPDTPNPSDTSINELIGMKKVTSVSLAVPVDTQQGSNTVTYNGKYYELVGLADAYTRGAHYVYISANILQTDFKAKTYRSVGLFSQPVFKSGVVGDTVQSDYITSQGRLQAVDNISTKSRDGLDILQYILIEA